MGLIDGRTRGELTHRLLITAAALIAYRAGVHIPVPGLEPKVLTQIEANGLERVSILALGVVPFITVLVLFELAKVLAPQLRRWEQSSSANTRSLNWMVLILAMLAAAAQASGVAIALEGVSGLVADPGIPFRLACVGTLVAGSAITIWLANQITQRGIGSGVWLLFAAPLLADFPWRVAALGAWQADASLLASELAIGGAFVVVVFAAITVLVRAESAAATSATCLWSAQLAQALLPLLLLPLMAQASPLALEGYATSTIVAQAILIAIVALFYARSQRLGGADGPSLIFSFVIGATLAALTLANLALPVIVERLVPRSAQLIILAVVAISILLPWWQLQTPRASDDPVYEDDEEKTAQSSGGNR
jgi:hypothetical protein